MKRRSRKQIGNIVLQEPIRPGSPLHMAISQVAARIAEKLDADVLRHPTKGQGNLQQRPEHDTSSGSTDSP